MSDSFTEVSSQSWFGRIGGAFKGIVFGLILVLIAFPVLFKNEGRAVNRYKTLKEGGKAVIAVVADNVNSANEGKLVHLGGRADSEATLSDPVFGISDNALKLNRVVEMYQWEETSDTDTKKKVGGGTTTTKTYSYSKTWSDSPIRSSAFKKAEGHKNPSAMLYRSAEQVADEVTLGAFVLSSSLVGKINNYEELPVEADTPMPEELKAKGKLHDSGFYIGADPSEPQIGDCRVHFRVAKPAVVSVIARQINNTFESYLTKVGGKIELLQVGVFSADAMIQKAQDDNKVLTWILRGLGFILMVIGFNLIFKPLSVFADVIPILGNIVGAGTGIIAFLLAAMLSLTTIAVGWIIYRPLLGIGLLAVVVGLLVVITRKLKAPKSSKTE